MGPRPRSQVSSDDSVQRNPASVGGRRKEQAGAVKPFMGFRRAGFLLCALSAAGDFADFHRTSALDQRIALKEKTMTQRLCQFLLVPCLLGAAALESTAHAQSISIGYGGVPYNPYGQGGYGGYGRGNGGNNGAYSKEGYRGYFPGSYGKAGYGSGNAILMPTREGYGYGHPAGRYYNGYSTSGYFGQSYSPYGYGPYSPYRW